MSIPSILMILNYLNLNPENTLRSFILIPQIDISPSLWLIEWLSGTEEYILVRWPHFYLNSETNYIIFERIFQKICTWTVYRIRHFWNRDKTSSWPHRSFSETPNESYVVGDHRFASISQRYPTWARRRRTLKKIMNFRKMDLIKKNTVFTTGKTPNSLRGNVEKRLVFWMNVVRSVWNPSTRSFGSLRFIHFHFVWKLEKIGFLWRQKSKRGERKNKNIL